MSIKNEHASCVRLFNNTPDNLLILSYTNCVKNKLLITTCYPLLKSDFLILNWDGWLTQTEELIDCDLSHR